MALPKRLTGTLLAILCSSIVATLFILYKGLTGVQGIEVFKIYACLIGGITGAYQGVQSYTDTKKKGTPNGDK